MSRQSPFRKAVEKIAVLWAGRNAFTRISAHVFTRPASIPDVLEVVELQKSDKHPRRTFTINLGMFHPGYTTDPRPTPEAIASYHCARQIRIGHVMPKRFWRRLFVWLRFGSGWHWGEVFPGDFSWSYRDGDESLSVAMHHALAQVERHGLPWFLQFASLGSAEALFNQSDILSSVSVAPPFALD